ncbi:MAG: signal peptidase II [Planctomycetes bacterium]|nr:signal peptidase II [Planctomycetota bacterium]
MNLKIFAGYRKLFFIALVLAVALDLWSKHAVFDWLECEVATYGNNTARNHEYQFMPGFFHITCAWNDGSAFGLFRGKTTGLVIVTFVAGLMLIYMFLTASSKHKLPNAALGMLTGGAIGNAYDRVNFIWIPEDGTPIGLVRDFLFFPQTLPIMNEPWPVFNVADCCIVLGVIGLFIDFWLHPKKDDVAGKVPEAESNNSVANL